VVAGAPPRNRRVVGIGARPVLPAALASLTPVVGRKRTLLAALEHPGEGRNTLARIII